MAFNFGGGQSSAAQVLLPSLGRWQTGFRLRKLTIACLAVRTDATHLCQSDTPSDGVSGFHDLQLWICTRRWPLWRLFLLQLRCEPATDSASVQQSLRTARFSISVRRWGPLVCSQCGLCPVQALFCTTFARRDPRRTCPVAESRGLHAGFFGASTSALSFGSVGAFGAQSQAASAPSLFGGTTPAFGGFGAPQTQTQFAFNAPASSAQNQLAPAAFSGLHTCHKIS